MAKTTKPANTATKAPDAPKPDANPAKAAKPPRSTAPNPAPEPAPKARPAKPAPKVRAKPPGRPKKGQDSQGAAPSSRARVAIHGAAEHRAALQTRRMNRAKARALAALAAGASYTKAAEAAKVTRSTLLAYRANDPDFEEACREAEEQGTDKLEDLVMDHAENGTQKPIFYRGEVAGYEVQFDHQLALHILQVRRERWRIGKTLALTGANGGPVQVQAVKERVFDMLDAIAPVKPAEIQP